MSKRILFILIGIAFSISVSAQKTLFFENFNSSSGLSGFKLVNSDLAIPSDTSLKSLKDSAWIVQNINSDNKAAIATSNNNNSVSSDDWMISPMVRIGNQSFLSFDAKALTIGKTDTIEIRISTTEQSVAGCLFNSIVETVYISNYTSFDSYNLPLNQYSNKKIAVGFRLNSDGKGTVAIDNIKIEDLSNDFVDLKFYVNMQHYINAEKFNPDVDFVDIVGNFNNWNGSRHILQNTADSVNAYFISIPGFYVNDSIEFKFRINGSWNDSIIEFPGGKPNRTWIIGEELSYKCFYNDNGTPFSVNDNLYNQNIKIYPNPFVDRFLISLKQNILIDSYKIFDISGKLVQTGLIIPTETINIEFKNSVPNFYFISLYYKNQLVTTKKILKTNK